MRFVTQGFFFGIFSFISALAIALMLLAAGATLNPREYPVSPATAIITAPILEEFIFRFIPIKLVGWFTQNTKILWTVILLSTLSFGIAHGSWYNVFIQGAAGIIFAAAFLRGGYFTSVIAHATHNSFVTLLISLL